MGCWNRLDLFTHISFRLFINSFTIEVEFTEELKAEEKDKEKKRKADLKAGLKAEKEEFYTPSPTKRAKKNANTQPTAQKMASRTPPPRVDAYPESPMMPSLSGLSISSPPSQSYLRHQSLYACPFLGWVWERKYLRFKQKVITSWHSNRNKGLCRGLVHCREY